MKYLEQIRQYWNSRSEGYRLQIEKELDGHHEETYLRYFSQIPPGSSVLDIGCGPGYFSLLLSSLGMKVTAADYSEKMLEQAKNLLNSTAFKNVKFIRADAQCLPFEDNSVDAVVSRNLVWNLESPEAAYAEWLRILKPRGKLFVFDGNHYCYLYNEDYASVQEQVEKESNHILLDVDPKTIDHIAEELPLSRHMRPMKDKEILTGLGAKNVYSEILVWEETAERKKLPSKFFVSATK